MTERDALRDALAEVQHYSLTVEPDDSAYMELDRDGQYVLIEDVDAVVAALAGSEPAGLREAVLFGPPVHFPFLDEQPTGPDVLDAVAYWMDVVDDRDGNPNRDVQEHLREWATRLRAALAPTPTASPTALVCPACGNDRSHDWWTVGDDSYACDLTASPTATVERES